MAGQCQGGTELEWVEKAVVGGCCWQVVETKHSVNQDCVDTQIVEVVTETETIIHSDIETDKDTDTDTNAEFGLARVHTCTQRW